MTLGPVDTHRAAITPATRSMKAGTPATPRLPASQSPGTPRIREDGPDRVPPAVQIPVMLPITVRLLRAGITVLIPRAPGSASGPSAPPALSAMRAPPSMRAPQPGTIGDRIRSPSQTRGGVMGAGGEDDEADGIAGGVRAGDDPPVGPPPSP